MTKIESIWVNGKELRTNALYKFFLKGRRRGIIGVPVGITYVTDYSLWHGCEAVRVAVWYRRRGWHRATFDKIIPIPAIRAIEFVEEL